MARKLNYSIPFAPATCSLDFIEHEGRILSYSEWVEEDRFDAPDRPYPLHDCYARCYDVQTGEEVRLKYGEITRAENARDRARTGKSAPIRNFDDLLKAGGIAHGDG